MFEITDLHNHSLYGVDDGAQDSETMCRMLNMAYDNGVRHICFTPHFFGDDFDADMCLVRRSYEEAGRYCEENCKGLMLYLGAEIMYHYECIDAINQNRQMLISNSRHVLVEFDVFAESQTIKHGVMRLLSCGYIPLIAHVERYFGLHKHIDVIVEMLDAGALVQINANSLFGGFFSIQRRMCRKLLKKRLVSVIASDAHDTEFRTPHIKKAAEYIISKYGYDYAKKLFCDMPQKILSNKRCIQNDI